jgi:hypothetical protein
MSDEISGMVQKSVEFGVAIPENMKPLIEALVEQGQLVDENGTKINDLSKLKWGGPVETEADKIATAMGDVVAKLDELITKMAGLPGTAAAAAEGISAGLAGVQMPEMVLPFDMRDYGGLEVPGFATGVRNFAGGLAVVGERGPELVSLPRGSSVYPNGARPGGGTVVIPWIADGREVAQMAIDYSGEILAVRGR